MQISKVIYVEMLQFLLFKEVCFKDSMNDV